MSAAVSVPGARVALSTASVYPEGCAAGFAYARRLGYDGVEVMVWTDPWTKVDKSIELALEVGAETVVLHPPFRWQRDYAREFVDGVALRERETGIRLAVENMFPWRARNREYLAYLPGWDPVPLPYANVTLDLSHTATAGSDALQMADDLGPRLTHVHLADGTGSAKDEHLVPGRGGQPCAEFLETLATQGYSGTVVVEVGTRKLVPEEREVDLTAALAFARLHLASARTLEST
jgi:sugar phosphate isomerase/epimerase